jgi:hypothetical protein
LVTNLARFHMGTGGPMDLRESCATVASIRVLALYGSLVIRTVGYVGCRPPRAIAEDEQWRAVPRDRARRYE